MLENESAEWERLSEHDREVDRRGYWQRIALRIQYWWYPIFKSHVYNCNINLWKLVLLLTWINDSVDNILALLHIVCVYTDARSSKDILWVLIVNGVIGPGSLRSYSRSKSQKNSFSFL